MRVCVCVSAQPATRTQLLALEPLCDNGADTDTEGLAAKAKEHTPHLKGWQRESGQQQQQQQYVEADKLVQA